MRKEIGIEKIESLIKTIATRLTKTVRSNELRELVAVELELEPKELEGKGYYKALTKCIIDRDRLRRKLADQHTIRASLVRDIIKPHKLVNYTPVHLVTPEILDELAGTPMSTQEKTLQDLQDELLRRKTTMGDTFELWLDHQIKERVYALKMYKGFIIYQENTSYSSPDTQKKFQFKGVRYSEGKAIPYILTDMDYENVSLTEEDNRLFLTALLTHPNQELQNMAMSIYLRYKTEREQQSRDQHPR